MQACGIPEIHQSFTSDHHPKGNTNTERFMLILKEAQFCKQMGA
jgi:hypothetical protein